jgi:hypothetical protein
MNNNKNYEHRTTNNTDIHKLTHKTTHIQDNTDIQTTHINKNGILFNEQYGFRRNMSTEIASHKLSN